MKLSLTVPNNTRVATLVQPWEDDVGGPEIARVAALADELGFHRISVGEHFLIPREHIALSGSHYMQTTTALGYLAGHTKRIRVSSNVTILPLQNPIIHAKSWAVLDWLSGGRADLVVGVGWLKDEFDVLGVDFHRRGRICDEYVEAMIELWTNDLASYDGEFIRFGEIASDPKPVQQPHVPLWFAGDAPGVLRRVARWGVGWSPFQTPPEQISSKLDRIRNHPEYRGQHLDVFVSLSALRLADGHRPKESKLDFDTTSAQELIDVFSWLQGLGVTEAAMPIPKVASFEAYLDRLHWLSEDVMPALAGETS